MINNLDTDSYFKKCIFKYNNAWYGGYRSLLGSSVEFYICGNYNYENNYPIAVAYFDKRNQTIMNQEIAESLIDISNYYSQRTKYYQISNTAATVTTNINVNAGGGGKSILLLVSSHWSYGNNTSTQLLLGSCGHDSNIFNVDSISSITPWEPIYPNHLTITVNSEGYLVFTNIDLALIKIKIIDNSLF